MCVCVCVKWPILKSLPPGLQNQFRVQVYTKQVYSINVQNRCISVFRDVIALLFQISGQENGSKVSEIMRVQLSLLSNYFRYLANKMFTEYLK